MLPHPNLCFSTRSVLANYISLCDCIDKSSLPSSSQELADIFGNSDDEDMEFPFSLNNVDKTFPHLSLPDGRDTEFFLNSLNSLSRMPVTLNTPSAEQLLKKKAPLDNKVPSDCRRENTKKATGDNDVGTKGVKKDSGAGRVNNGASSDGVKEDTLKEDVTAGNREDGEEKKEDEAVTATRAGKNNELLKEMNYLTTNMQ